MKLTMKNMAPGKSVVGLADVQLRSLHKRTNVLVVARPPHEWFPYMVGCLILALLTLSTANVEMALQQLTKSQWRSLLTLELVWSFTNHFPNNACLIVLFDV